MPIVRIARKVRPVVLLKLFLLFTLLPIVELALLFQLSSATSPTTAISLVIGTGILGALLARSQGWYVWRRVQNDLAQGRAPTDALFEGVLVLIAGVVLITPGMITDGVGLLLLIPPSRRWIQGRIVRRIQSKNNAQSFATSPLDPENQDTIIDVRVIDAPSEGEPQDDA